MRVFNKEVRGCFECKYNAAEGQGGYTMCKYIYEDTDDLGSEKFHKDCPFNKSITKEVIEGFGFEIFNYRNIECFNLKNYLLFKFENNNFISIDKFPDIPRHCESGNNCFRGTINNQIELAFILKSIGVIE